MNDHVESWIDAYLDGELSEPQKQMVEAHLAGCASCQALLGGAQALSNLLQQVPPADGLKPERQFVAEVGLQLERRPSQRHAARKWLELGWFTFPVLLLISYAFLLALSASNQLLQLIPGIQPALSSQGSFLPTLPSYLLNLVNDILGLNGIADLFDWNALSILLGLACVSLLSLGWLAIGWAYHHENSATHPIPQRS